MAWLSKNNFSPSDSAAADDLNNLANDVRFWGGNVNGGGYHLSNVIIDNYFPGAGVPLLSPIHIIPTSTDYSSQLRLDSEVAGNPARWIIIKDQAAETGLNNAGSNFAIYRCADNGTTIDSPIYIDRSSGIVTLKAQQWAGNVNGGGFTLTNVIIPSVFQDPTTAQGDLIARGASATGRLAIGTTDGMVLQVDSTQPFKMKWAVSPAVPYSRQILTPVGSGLSGGGDLSQDRSLAADVLSVAGKKGAVTLAVADVAGAVPNTRSVLAGAGLTGGGALTADVTLNANVISVANKTGAVSLVAADVSGAVPTTRQIVAGAGIAASTTSDLSKDVTVTALVTSVFGRIGAVNINATDIANGGGVPATRQVLTATGSGLSGGGNLGADLNLAVVNNTSIQKVNWASGSGSVVGARSTLNFISGSNITISLADNAVSDRMDVTLSGTGVTAIWSNGVLIGNRPAINFIAGSNVTITPTDNSSQNRVDITFSAVGGTGGGGSQTPWTAPIDAAGNSLANVSYIGANRSLDITTRIAVQTTSTETGMRVASALATSGASLEVDNDNATAKLLVTAYGSGFGGSLQATSGLNATAGPMTLAINSSEAMRISAGKRVLIGTATDDGTNLLQVNGKIKSLSGGIVFPDGTTQITAGVTTAGATQTPWLTDIDAANHNLLHLNSINSGGPALGIGTLTPASAALHVVNSQALTWVALAENYGQDASFRGRIANGTPASPTAVISGQIISGVRGLGYNGSAWTGALVALDMFAAENWTPSANGTLITLSTTPKGATATAERVRIADSGFVGIGTASPIVPLQVTGNVMFGTGGGFNMRTVNLVGATLTGLSLLTTATGAAWYIDNRGNNDAPNNRFAISAGSADLFTILPSGYVGIGTTSPTMLFSAVGNVIPTVVQMKASVSIGDNGVGNDGFLQVGIFGFMTGNSFAANVAIGQNFANKAVSQVTTYFTPNTHANLGYAGIEFHAGNTMFYGAAGATTAGAAITPAERMRITPAGNVGIGTASPGAKLDLGPPVASTVQAILTTGLPDGAFQCIVQAGPGTPTTSGTEQFRLGMRYSSAGWGCGIRFLRGVGATDSMLAFDSNAGERMRIDNAGNVGIGTVSPGATLSVSGNVLFQKDANSLVTSFGTAQLTISGVTDGRKSLWLGFDTGANVGAIQAGTSGVSWNSLVLNAAGGNVGIGTTNPKNALFVNGNAFFQASSAPPDPGDGSGPGLRLGYSSSSDYGYIFANNTGVVGKNLILQVSGGSVGIGNAAPNATLHINPTTGYVATSLTHNAPAHAMVTIPGGTELAINCAGAGASYGYTFQVRNSSSDGAGYPLVLNPLGGNVCIAGPSPSANLTVGNPLSTGSYSTSPYFLVNTGFAMPATAGYEIPCSTLAALITPNVSQFNIRARRSANLNDWNHNDFILSHDVDGVVRAPGSYVVLTGLGKVLVNRLTDDGTGAGLQVGGTISANGVLVGAAPGAWTPYTPTVTDGTGAGLTLTGNICSYCVFGSLLFIQFNLGYTGNANTGTVNVYLPVTVTSNANVSAYQHVGSSPYNNVVDMIVGSNYLQFYMGSGTNGLGVGLKIGGVLRIT